MLVSNCMQKNKFPKALMQPKEAINPHQWKMLDCEKAVFLFFGPDDNVQ